MLEGPFAGRQGQLLKTACGSPCYAAPEMIAGTGRTSGIVPARIKPSQRCHQSCRCCNGCNGWCQRVLYSCITIQLHRLLSCLMFFLYVSTRSQLCANLSLAWMLHACMHCSSSDMMRQWLTCSGATPLWFMELWRNSFCACLWIFAFWGLKSGKASGWT